MPVSVVVGGQFGSEGKGKVAHFLAKSMNAAIAVRVGGSNSGHSVVQDNGIEIILRHLPTAAIESNVHCALPAGCYLDLDVLLQEIEFINLTADRLSIDPMAVMISTDDKSAERDLGLVENIGSTGSGTGAALIRRIQRRSFMKFAKDEPCLRPYIKSTARLLRESVARGERIVLEGTQGFGLSLFHGIDFPHVTSRDTTAAGFLSEAGLSPLDVDDIVLVLRAFPIRVSGNSGALPSEIDWSTVTTESESTSDIIEYTSVSKRIRRVARFHPDVVQKAIEINAPTRIVLNHLDQIDATFSEHAYNTERIRRFVRGVETTILRQPDLLGFGPNLLVPINVLS